MGRSLGVCLFDLDRAVLTCTGFPVEQRAKFIGTEDGEQDRANLVDVQSEQLLAAAAEQIAKAAIGVDQAVIEGDQDHRFVRSVEDGGIFRALPFKFGVLPGEGQFGIGAFVRVLRASGMM